MGTYGTFVEPTQYWLQILLEACSKDCSESLRGIGVDPVEETLGPLEQVLAQSQEKSEVSLLFGAAGETSGEQTVFCLKRGVRLRLRKVMEKHPSEYARVVVDMHLAYLENMSAIGGLHPDFKQNERKVKKSAGIDECLIEQRPVHIYTFEDILKMHNASGCEVLIIDAEGSDCAILRSMIQSCERGFFSWPQVIRFETRGSLYCSNGDGVCEEEEDVLFKLQQHHYLLVELWGDATLVHQPALSACHRLAAWADAYFMLRCYVCSRDLRPSSASFTTECGQGSVQWRGTLRDQGTLRWCVGWCCSTCLTA
eukprot:TRINITY_DN20190_c0_g1_i1.p1 TRINITY_DN20190_c0_g1~~TRINITY_DN20190_c0_g1_i1.p1  ORF type:complete len:311 (-),score=49.51 TRINITY_DN20190_c0_g1_i1:254-1186(-)